MGDFVTFAKPWRFRPGTLAGVFPLPTLPPLVLLLVLHGSRDDLRRITPSDLEREVSHAVANTSPAGFGEVKVTVNLQPGSSTRLEITQLPGEPNVRLAPGTPAGKVVAQAIRQAFKRTNLGLREEVFQIKVAAPIATVASIICGSDRNMAAIADYAAREPKRDSRRGTRPPASRFAQEARAT